VYRAKRGSLLATPGAQLRAAIVSQPEILAICDAVMIGAADSCWSRAVQSFSSVTLFALHSLISLPVHPSTGAAHCLLYSVGLYILAVLYKMMPTAIILALYNAAVSDCIFHLRHFSILATVMYSPLQATKRNEEWDGWGQGERVARAYDGGLGCNTVPSAKSGGRAPYGVQV